MAKSADQKALETRIRGGLALAICVFFFFFVTDSVFMGTDIDVRWLLVLFVPTALAMIGFPHVKWLQKD